MTTQIFINHVDQYSSKNIAKIISRTPIGESIPEREEKEVKSYYRVVGSLSTSSIPQELPVGVEEVATSFDREAVQKLILASTVVIYDITGSPDQVDEASWAVSLLAAEMNAFKEPKIFILVSTVLTWAKTKAQSEEDEASFAEDEYRRRKPHVNFKTHINAEKLVIKCGKQTDGRLFTFVVAAGVLYGAEEAVFHSLFKAAWTQQPPELPLYGSGQNIIPTIHVHDLASVLVCVLENKPETHYIIAIDDASSTLEDITKAISTTLGTSKMTRVTREELLSNPEISQGDADALLLNIKLVPAILRDFKITWISQAGLVANIDKIAKEFKIARKLTPLKVVLLGPPSSGKTELSKKLSAFYEVPHIHIKAVIEDQLKGLAALAARISDDSLEDTAEAEAAKEALEATQKFMSENNGRLDDERLLPWVQKKLMSMTCRNQGYILDGFPKVEEQAKKTFADPTSDTPDEPDREQLPEFVFVLNAPENVLKERVLNLPESVVAGTHNNDEGFTRRLAEYKARNTEDTSLVNFFDVLEVHPTELSAEDLKATFEEIKKLIGSPRNYGPSPAQKAIQLAQQAALDEAARKEQQEKEAAKQAALQAENAKKQLEWNGKLAEVRRQEQEALELASSPLRSYLMKHLMPTLTQGLLEVCKSRPDDPVDFLAEYLFKVNPQIE